MKVSVPGGKILAILCALLIAGAAISATHPRRNPMNIVFTTQSGATYTAQLANGSAAQDFYAMLPLVVDFEDYAGAESIGRLPRKLDTRGEADSAGRVGDINYYAPWGNLALFYQARGKAPGLVHLGTMHGGAQAVKALQGKGVKIEKAP